MYCFHTCFDPQGGQKGRCYMGCYHGGISMGHRNKFPPQLTRNEHDESSSRIQAVQPYMCPDGVAANGSNSHVYPSESFLSDRAHFDSSWIAVPRSGGQSLSSGNIERPPYQPDVLGPSHDCHVHVPATEAFPLPENSFYHASSSNYEGPALVDSGFVDLTLSNGRGACKRKSPGIPPETERGSSSRYYCAGSSSDVLVFSEPMHEKPNLSSQPLHWDHTNPIQRGDGNAVFGDEGALRNVRSRSTFVMESNLSAAQSSNFSSNQYPICHFGSLSNLIDPSGSTSSSQNWLQNHVYTSSGPHGRMQTSVAECDGSNHRAGHFLSGTSSNDAPIEIEHHHNDFNLSRIPPIPPSFHGSLTPPPPSRGTRSSYSHRSLPTFRASQNNLHLGHVGASDENLQLIAENRAIRFPRPFSHSGWRNSERSARSRVTHERYRSSQVETSTRDRLATEGLMIADQSTVYGSRSLSDQHRDMRLDIDNMSYEELLALGERIGNVSTGLSEDLISKCFTDTGRCLSEQQVEMEESCAICLEEYEKIDGVRMLRSCGHGYHADCIRKWLSMKNSCPICKRAALPDSASKEG